MTDLLQHMPKRSDLINRCVALWPAFDEVKRWGALSNEQLHTACTTASLPDCLHYSALPFQELRGIATKRFPEVKGNRWLNVTKPEILEALETGELPAKLKQAEHGNTVDAAELIKQALEMLSSGKAGNVDETEVEGIAAKVFAKLYADAVPTRLEIVQQDKPPVITGDSHKMFPKVLKLVAAKQNLWLHGPAGTGKTSIGKQAAHALGLRAVAMPCGDMMQVSDILGYKDAVGNYVPTLFRDFYENGGVYIFDEVDAGNSNTYLAKNAAIDSMECAFPDKVVQRHPDFVCIACANTIGNGHSMEYVGRNAIDGATKDRYTFLHIDYDEEFELRLTLAAWPENPAKATAWCKRVQAIRKAVAELKERILVTPRASLKGVEVQRSGGEWDFAELEEMLIFKGTSADTVEKIRRRASAVQ